MASLSKREIARGLDVAMDYRARSIIHDVASFPGPAQLSVAKSWAGPGKEARLDDMQSKLRVLQLLSIFCFLILVLAGDSACFRCL